MYLLFHYLKKKKVKIKMATNFTKVPNEKKVKIKVATNFTKVPNECTLVHCNFSLL